MNKLKKILKEIGMPALVIAVIALIVMIMAGVLYTGPKTSNGDIWASFVAGFTHSILGVSQWFGDLYGLGILIFTILVRLFILPLMMYQVGESMKMQELQPKMKLIQNKYPTKDRESMALQQQETQALYKDAGVNPFASMLPLLIQMPILLALYQSIWNSDTLKSGSFLWVKLGQADPYFILPILAAALTFVSSWLSMKAAPEANGVMKSMPYIMPFIILLSAMFMPSALALYWTMSSAFQAVQTYWLQNPFKLAEQRQAKKDAAKQLERQKERLMHGGKKKR